MEENKPTWKNVIDPTTIKGKNFRNKKNGEIYEVLGLVINATNGQDDKTMIHYIPISYSYLGDGFVREIDEFFMKFESID